MTDAPRQEAPTALRWELPVAALLGVLGIMSVAAGLMLGGSATGLDERLLLVESTVAATAGLVILRMRPRHPIGRLLVAVALLDGLMELTTGYSDWAYATEPIRAGGGAVRALREYGWPPLLLVFGSILLRFPTGQPLTTRWRTLEKVLWGWLALWAVTIVTPRAFTDHPRLNGMDNPLGIPALEPLAGVIAIAVAVVLLPLFVSAIASVFVRFRRARGDERQQIKWLLYFASPLVLVIIIMPTWTAESASRVMFGVITVLLITGIAVGVLRFRLYDVDRVIRRTVSYGAITSILVAAYALAVTGLAPLLQPSGGSSDLTVAVATLAVAGLFNPVRRRVQTWVDQRFNRSRLQAQEAIDRFGDRLRREVDVRVLTTELARVAGETMQPDQVAVWLAERGVRA